MKKATTPYVIQNCSFIANNGMNEHTALAAKALAEAMLELAKAFNKPATDNYIGVNIKP